MEEIKKKVEVILNPIKSDETIKHHIHLQRCHTGMKLPSYYLVYFLFNELLEYNNVGRWEKVAWSFPIRYNGKLFTIDFRKLGLGVFTANPEADIEDAKEIVQKISGAVKAASQFYDQIANDAVKKSELNVINRNEELFERFNFLRESYTNEIALYEEKKDKTEKVHEKDEMGEWWTYTNLGAVHRRNANHLAISCIEAFYSWTEHLFIHLAIINEGLFDGEKIADLIGAEWKTKFKAAITDNSPATKKYYDELLEVRQQLRNFVAHGAFGKNGNAFQFHSKAGAVPVIMSHKRRKNRFSLYGRLIFDNAEVLKLIDEFIEYLNNELAEAAMIYTQKYALPAILTLARDGNYDEAISSVEQMEEYCHGMMRHMANSANMDW